MSDRWSVGITWGGQSWLSTMQLNGHISSVRKSESLQEMDRKLYVLNDDVKSDNTSYIFIHMQLVFSPPSFRFLSIQNRFHYIISKENGSPVSDLCHLKRKKVDFCHFAQSAIFTIFWKIFVFIQPRKSALWSASYLG